METLQSYSWPGNVRELKNLIERAMILNVGSTLIINRLEGEEPPTGRNMALGEVERKHILQILEQTGWRVSGASGAARLLGLNESTLRSRMHKLGITRPG
jgi:transcriptional regulator with GAF, ATPase, and Fis domain